MTRNQRKRAIARMRAWQEDERGWGKTGARLRRNVLNGSVLWSQTPDTEWYRENWNPPQGFLRLVATWPVNQEEYYWLEEDFLYLPPATGGTLTGWGREGYFVADESGDRPLTQKERAAVLAALNEVEAPAVKEVLPEQIEKLQALNELGALTETERATINGPVFNC